MLLDALVSPAAPARVQVVFRSGGDDLDLDLTLAPQAVVADIVRALADDDDEVGRVLVVDGRAVAPDATGREAGLRPGSLLELSAAAVDESTNRGHEPVVAELRVVGGLHAGATFGLTPGRHIVGAAADAQVVLSDATVSGRHVELWVDPLGTVVITDVASTNGTRVDGDFVLRPRPLLSGALVELGAAQLAVAPTDPPPAEAAGRAGLVTFNRPPRPACAPPPRPIQAPDDPPPPAPRSPLAWAALVAPMVMGGVMAVVWDPRMALFALFTPVMMLATWFEDRRRARKHGRRTASEAAVALERFRRDLDGAAAETITRRRASLPDPAEVAARAMAIDTRLWERRPEAVDFLQLRIGTAAVPWRPELTNNVPPAAAARRVLVERPVLERAPFDVDLRPGRTLGVVGDRAAVESLLRSLVLQAATLHGPADLRIAVLTDAARAEGWGWAKWLPHTQGAGDAAGLQLLAAAEADLSVVLGALAAMAPAAAGPHQPAIVGPARLVVVDADGLTEGRRSPARALLAGATGAVAGIVVAAETARLPALCTTVLELDGPDGLAHALEPRTNQRIDEVVIGGATQAAVHAAARSLAGIEDPEVREVGASLPDRVGLLPLLAMTPTVAEVIDRWAAAGPTPALRAPLGLTDDGPLVLDLVADGPHGLIGGTTGSGKSELLRTLVVSLAASTDPEHLTFVLIDYKGGSAFDACARLPHTVGLVTDLDQHLGQRALRCLDAELRHREGILRAAGASDLPHYLSMARPTPLPRLVVVIDEFATLATELPDFIDALVGVAQRGRSLGVHLLLATQRPAGVVKDNIRANTDLRIALRMHDAADSTDVLGSPAAAAIGRRQAGRGYVRLGPVDTRPFQAAVVSMASKVGPAPVVAVSPFVFGPGRQRDSAVPPPSAADGLPTDLERLVDAIVGANDALELAPARRPWPEPLSADLALGLVDPAPTAAAARDRPRAVLGLADDPAHQRQVPLEWDGADGGLLLYGVAGSGTTTALDTLARSLARRHRPEDLHLYVLDFGAGDLASLVELPQVGAVVSAAETERQRRLFRHLRRELESRRQAGAVADPIAPRPSIVVLLDNWSGFASVVDDVAAPASRDEISRLVADGPAVGIWMVIAADSPSAVPLSIASLVPAKLVFRLADHHDYAGFGFGPGHPGAASGRAFDTRTRLEVQVARASGVPWRTGRRTAPPIGVLPTEVTAADVGPPGIGVLDSTLAAVRMPFREAESALVSGPPRSGKSATLCRVASTMIAQGYAVSALAPRSSSPLHAAPSVRGVATLHDLVVAAGAGGRHVLVIDDAESVDDPLGELSGLLSERHPDIHVVAAGRADALRCAYGHWTRDLRASRLGIALRPEPEDGELFGCVFPRRDRPASLPGRGYLVVDGEVDVVQIARP